LDLYAARNRKLFISEVARELGSDENTIKTDLGRVLLKLEELQEAQVNEALKPKDKTPAMTDADRAAHWRCCNRPICWTAFWRTLSAAGVVGEATNKLTGYLAATSRSWSNRWPSSFSPAAPAGKKQSDGGGAGDAAAGGSDQVQRDDRSIVVLHAGVGPQAQGAGDRGGRSAERASYALKLLQSEGELTIASTGKDPQTGRLVTQGVPGRGAVMIFLTTTAAEIDEELLNRCLVLSVNEEREQTAPSTSCSARRQTLLGLLEQRQRAAVLKLHRDAQRLLKPMLVANPFAERLTFLDARTRSRRDHVKYLTLIRRGAAASVPAAAPDDRASAGVGTVHGVHRSHAGGCGDRQPADT